MMRVATLAAGLLLAPAIADPARAAYLVTFSQAGPDVVASGSGSIDTDGLTLDSLFSGQPPFIVPNTGSMGTGPTTDVALYAGTISGPATFGASSLTLATGGTGDFAGISVSLGLLGVPVAYVSGAMLSDTATYANATLAGLGLAAGTYTYSFGSGADADTFTIVVGASNTVPEPASLAVLGVGLLGLCVVQRRKTG